MRKIISLVLLIAGVIELLSSVILYIIPAGRVAYWSDYHLMGLSKTQWGDIHITVGTLLIIAASIHLFYNWKPIMAYLKNRAKKVSIFSFSFLVALFLSLYVTIGTLYRLPPMNFILQFGEYLTEQGNTKYGEPPYGHAELSSLAMFCDKMHIDPTGAEELLKKAGITISGTQETLARIADNSGKTPQQIYEIIKGNTTVDNSVFPDSPPPGFGRKSIAEICQLYSINEDDLLNKLQIAGIKAEAENTVKEVATQNNSNPMAIFEIIKEASSQGK